MFDFWRGAPDRGAMAGAISSCRSLFIAAAVFSALINLLYLTPTIYMMQVYDRAIPAGGHATLALLTIAALGGLAALSLLDWVRSRLLVRASARLDHALAAPVMDALLRRGRGGAERASAMRDFDTFRQSLAGPALLAALDAPWTPVFLIVGFMVHWTLGVMGLFSAAVLVGLALLNERATRSPLEAANRAAAASYTDLGHAARSAEAVRALGMRRGLVARQIVHRRHMLSLQNRASFATGRYLGLIKAVRLMLQSLALGLGAWLAIDRQISPGAVFAASFLLVRMMAPVEQVVGAWNSIALNRSAYRTLSELLADAESARPTQLPSPAGVIAVEGVGMTCGSAERPVLQGVSFDARPGEIVGLIGPSGAGKTSLARVLAGAVAPDRGTVRIDGAAYADWDAERLARSVGYLPQDFVLFAGTVKDNIARFRAWTGEDPEPLDRMAVEAAAAAGAHAMILRLPNGYDTVLGPGGSGLSAGQAQRVALARALFGGPRLLVLDEPNAHLDAEGEAALCTTLAALRGQGCTVILAAHRGAALGLADKLLVLEEGRAIRFGPAAPKAPSSRAPGLRPSPAPLSFAGPTPVRASA